MISHKLMNPALKNHIELVFLKKEQSLVFILFALMYSTLIFP